MARSAVILVDDPSDLRIAHYRFIRERDLIGRNGLFIAEGELVLRHLVESRRFETVSVLLAENRAAKLVSWIEARRPDTPVFVASQTVMDAIAGFPLHRGILGLGRHQSEDTPNALLGALPVQALILVLVGIGNHDNMGGLFRNAAAFGANGVLLDTTCCDPLYRKAIRVSVGAALLTPFARFRAADDIILELQRQAFDVIGFTPGGQEPLLKVTRSPRTAILFGSEGPGLPQELLARCRAVRIPMAAGFDSLNVATAAAIALHHLANALRA